VTGLGTRLWDVRTIALVYVVRGERFWSALDGERKDHLAIWIIGGKEERLFSRGTLLSRQT